MCREVHRAFVRRRRPRVTQRTADGYEGLLDRYVRPELGSKRVNQLETPDIQRLYAAMQ